jgi:hypothetical protein
MVKKLVHETSHNHVLSEIVQGTSDDPHPVSQNVVVKTKECAYPTDPKNGILFSCF